MQDKVTCYEELADSTISHICDSPQQLKRFLELCGRIYKYPYEDQLMIYAQRPDATAVANMKVWNKSMKRYVKRGAKAIRLLDHTDPNNTKLRYVFDEADTYHTKNSRDIPRWIMNDADQEVIARYLIDRYITPDAENMDLPEVLVALSRKLSAEYILTNEDEYALQLGMKNETEVWNTFEKLTCSSLTYTFLYRCGISTDSYITDDSFGQLSNIQSAEFNSALLNLICNISEQVFRDIERKLREEKREKRASEINAEIPVEISSADVLENSDFHNNEQLSLNLFLTEEQQIRFIDEAESRNSTAFSQDEIDHFLMLGSNTDESRKIVALEYMKEKNVEEIAQTLKQVYHGGFGLKEDSGNISAWYADDGIHLAKGSSARFHTRAQVISWGAAARRIGELLESGQFATNVELAEAPGYEREKLAQSIWYLYHDLSNEARDRNLLSVMQDVKGGGFPGQTEHLANLMTDAGFRSLLARDFQEFLDAYHAGEKILRFHYHKPDEISRRLNELELPLRRYQTDMTQMPLVRQFITDDEVNADLTRGSGFSGGKARIFEYWQESHSTKEKVDFLKQEYGTGGHSHACSGATFSGQDHDAKGVCYQKRGCDKAQLSWTQVVSRIDDLVNRGRYLSEEDLAKPEHFIDHFYVVEDIQKRGALDIKVYSSLDDALKAYRDLPSTQMKALGAENTRRSLPGSIDFVQCKDGQDTIIEDYIKVSGWENSEVLDAINQIETMLQSKEELVIPATNYRIVDDSLGEGSPRLKYAQNVAAIRTLFQLEAESRNATPQEQEILSNYVGWGGLADVFDPNKGSWVEEYSTLKGLLSEEEYAMARASTLNAHYTSPEIIRAIYDVVDRIGFKTGNILEPSMGIGNFFGCLPEHMRESRLYGIELDSISGRMAKKLYPQASIAVAGFETTNFKDFFDLAIGNVPFGDYRVNDHSFDKYKFSIHNYFFAKALDEVRPGGIVAFITSRYTMDSKNPSARKYLAKHAELIGAIRLPENAFKDYAGTVVVSDIIFLKKRDMPLEIEPDWVHLGMTEDGQAINSYFLAHPEMVLGKISTKSSAFGPTFTVEPIEGVGLGDQIKKAGQRFSRVYEDKVSAVEQGPELACIPAVADAKNFSFHVVDGKLYFRENSIMIKPDLKEKDQERAMELCLLRDLTQQIISYQLDNKPDELIKEKQRELERNYDKFVEKYGIINSKNNARIFDRDSAYYLLCSLENVDETGRLLSKADFFYNRTIRPANKNLSASNASEALAVSIGEKGCVDLYYMSELLKCPGEYDKILADLKGVIFRNPEKATSDPCSGYETADEYLSGNVRKKLQIAEAYAQKNGSYGINVEFLKKAQPKDLDASEIDIRLGATWVDKKYIQQFMEETFLPAFWVRKCIKVEFSEYDSSWKITGKSAVSQNDVNAYVTYGTSRLNAYSILEDTLNLKDPRVYDMVEYSDGGETKVKRVLNKKETILVQQKQQMIKDAFRDWIFNDADRRNELVRLYNEKFNSIRPREFDGSHINFVGMTPEIELREHQKNAVAHILYGGNTLLAHEVGAGKTFEMVAAAMESKRLGLCRKSLFVVPNHLTLQWANEFLRLYPGANILVANKKDFETANRKKFCARIATGEYDAVIIGHSQFEKIPLSIERQKRELESQINEIVDEIGRIKYQDGQRLTVKMMEKTRKSLQAKLDKLLSTERKDDVVTFEQLGVDRLFVDESHSFKNLFLYTKMRNVAGLSMSEAQKSSDMHMKCRYMDEITDNRGIVFATGTPVSNSMTELYTIMRYLQADVLKQMNLSHFDAWASTFGETQTAIELAPEGTGYRARTRFSKFYNLPELMSIFKQVADIKTADQLNLPVPEAVFETVLTQPSEIQKELVRDLSNRAAMVHNGSIDPSVDNMLKITSDGRKIGLDQRLIDPQFPDNAQSKLNTCIKNIHDIWKEGTEERLTQLVFCDLSTPKGDGKWNVYDNIRNKLILKGVPKEEIAFIHEADTEVKKKELFSKVRSGQVRVLIGSTQKMGAGTNVQDRLVALHHLDVGWKPSDMAQRNGRIIRQGNMNKKVKIYQYVTEDTFDAYLYQTLENKQKFISQIMTSKSPVRSCDDVDEAALSYAEIKALCAGNPLIKEKMDLDIDVSRLKVVKASFMSQKYKLEDQLLRYYPSEIARTTELIRQYENDIETANKTPVIDNMFCGMKLGGILYTDEKEAGKKIIDILKSKESTSDEYIGQYRGFDLNLVYDSFNSKFLMELSGCKKHYVNIGADAIRNVEKLNSALDDEMPQKASQLKLKLEDLKYQRDAANEKIKETFPQEEELREKTDRLAVLDSLLNLDDSKDMEMHEELDGNPDLKKKQRTYGR